MELYDEEAKKHGVRVLVKPVGDAPVETWVDGTLESYQAIVNGYCERIVLTPGAATGIDLVIDEEGLLKSVEFNFVSNHGVIMGNCFFVRYDAHGNWVSLTDGDVAALRVGFNGLEYAEEALS